MNWRRRSTSSPINTLNMRSASPASSSVTLRSMRLEGSSVVCQSSSLFISPRPLKRPTSIPCLAMPKSWGRTWATPAMLIAAADEISEVDSAALHDADELFELCEQLDHAAQLLACMAMQLFGGIGIANDECRSGEPELRERLAHRALVEDVLDFFLA